MGIMSLRRLNSASKACRSNSETPAEGASKSSKPRGPPTRDGCKISCCNSATRPTNWSGGTRPRMRRVFGCLSELIVLCLAGLLFLVKLDPVLAPALRAVKRAVGRGDHSLRGIDGPSKSRNSDADCDVAQRLGAAVRVGGTRNSFAHAFGNNTRLAHGGLGKQDREFLPAVT